MFCKNLVIFGAIFSISARVVESGCPSGARLYGKSTCLSDLKHHNMKEEMRKDCKQNGGDVGGPFADDIWEDFSAYIKSVVRESMETFKPWVGMKKPQTGFTDDGKWKYDPGDEEFDPADYPFFKQQPKDGEMCAYFSAENFDIQIIPGNCGDHHDFFCLKNEDPCNTYMGFRYFTQLGTCIVSQQQRDKYDNVRNICQNSGGDTLPIKNETVLRSATVAAFNSYFCGGIYMGLEKTAFSEEWKFIDGTPGPPDSAWDKDDPRKERCSFLRVNHDFSFSYISRHCNEKCVYVCQYPATD